MRCCILFVFILYVAFAQKPNFNNYQDGDRWIWGYVEETTVENKVMTLKAADTVESGADAAVDGDDDGAEDSENFPKADLLDEVNSTKNKEEDGNKIIAEYDPCELYNPMKPSFRAPGRKISEEACESYLWDVKLNEEQSRRNKECFDKNYANKLRPPAAVRRKATFSEEFPHMCALGWKAVDFGYIFKCEGTLISSKFVLTAAHCTRAPVDDIIVDSSPKIVRLNDKHQFSNESEGIFNSYATDMNIIRIINNPEYNAPERFNDIALVELERDVVFTNFMQPACLWNLDHISTNNRATLTGWGVLSFGSQDTLPEFQAADVNIINSVKCNLLLSSHHKDWEGMSYYQQFCAEKLSPCKIDSGRTLQVIKYKENSHVVYYVRGVATFGMGCDLSNLPVVYTMVSNYIDWIESIVWNDSSASFAASDSEYNNADGYWLSSFSRRWNPPTPRLNYDPCEGYNPDKPSFKAPGRRISEEKCEEFVWHIRLYDEQLKRQKQCVARNTPYQRGSAPTVGGGVPVYNAATFPHMGALGWMTTQGDYVFKCGCSLISSKFVLSAAHCSSAPMDDFLVDSYPKIVRFSHPLLFQSNGKTDENITRIIVHPYFKSPKKYYDIMLLELQTHVTFNPHLIPACLWTQHDTNQLGSQATITGWGALRYGSRETSKILQAAVVDFINSNQCDRLLNSSRNRRFWGLMEHQLCAGILAGGVDTCNGDSGGPLQVKKYTGSNETSIHYYLIGVTSFGIACTLPNLPGIYTRVSSFIDWIEGHVWK